MTVCEFIFTMRAVPLLKVIKRGEEEITCVLSWETFISNQEINKRTCYIVNVVKSSQLQLETADIPNYL